jgi:hypothetical protein
MEYIQKAAAGEANTLAVGELDKCPDDVAYEKVRLRVSLAKALAGCDNLTRASDAIRAAYEELERLVGDSDWLLADALGTAGRINFRNASVRRMSPGRRRSQSRRSKLTSPCPLPAYWQKTRCTTAPHANEISAPSRAIGKPSPGFWL